MDRCGDRTENEAGAGSVLRVDGNCEGNGQPERRALADESFLREVFLDLDRFLTLYVPADWDTRQALVMEAVLSYLTNYGELSCNTTEERESARRLLFCIARNAAIDWLRVERPQRLRADPDQLSRESCHRLDLMGLEEIVQTLTDDDREFLHLRYSRDLSFVEIGRRLHTSKWTVIRRLRRLLAALRSQLSRAS